jgi:Bacterial fructose-1,6-bisphosphatase, glpX-encoded
LERLPALEMIRVTKAAAIASVRLMGRGDTMDADRIAVEAMRRTFEEIPIDARIVIGEGERDQAPEAERRESGTSAMTRIVWGLRQHVQGRDWRVPGPVGRAHVRRADAHVPPYS